MLGSPGMLVAMQFPLGGLVIVKLLPPHRPDYAAVACALGIIDLEDPVLAALGDDDVAVRCSLSGIRMRPVVPTVAGQISKGRGAIDVLVQRRGPMPTRAADCGPRPVPCRLKSSTGLVGVPPCAVVEVIFLEAKQDDVAVRQISAS